MPSLRAALAALLVPVVAGCREPQAGLHVEIDGPLVPGTDFDRLSLVAYLADDGTPLYSDSLDAPDLPVSFNLLSGPGTPEGTKVEVLASAERAGEVVSAARGTGVLRRGEGETLRLTLPAIPAAPDGGIVEVCDDRVDDDGDGLADCADPDCEASVCGSGGRRCVMGACGCPGGAPLGVWWTPVSGFAARSGAQAIALDKGPAAGAVLLAGGTGADGQPTGVVELYRPGIALQTITLQVARTDATFLVTDDGSVLVAGGVTVPAGDRDPLPIEVLDLGSLQSTEGALVPELAFSDARALKQADGWLLFGGSLGADVVALRPLDAGSPAWSQQKRVTLARARSAAVRLADGRVLFASGPTATELTELLSEEGEVAIGPGLPVALAGAALLPLPGGAALLVGGEGPDGEGMTSAYVFSAQGESVSLRLAGELHQAIADPVAVELGNGWVYVEARDGTAAEWFDFASERFVPATPPPTPTSDAALAVLGGRIFRAGGVRLGDGAVSDEGAFLEPACAP